MRECGGGGVLPCSPVGVLAEGLQGLGAVDATRYETESEMEVFAVRVCSDGVPDAPWVCRECPAG